MAENKEQLINNPIEQNSEQFQRPVEGMVDLKKNEEAFVPREVKGWLEKVEEETNNLQKTNTDATGIEDVLIDIKNQPVKITLPTTKKTFASGFNKTFSEAGRWLSEFVFKLIKKEKGNVKFNEE